MVRVRPKYMRLSVIAAFLALLILLPATVIAPHQPTETATTSATASVAAFVDITLTTGTTPGFAFSGDPGTSRNPEAENSSPGPAATVTREATSNKDVDIRLSGADFSVLTPPATIPVDPNVVYDDDATVDEGVETGLPQATLTNGFPLAKYTTLTAGSSTLPLRFYLNIPSGQAAGSYTSTFNFQGS